MKKLMKTYVAENRHEPEYKRKWRALQFNLHLLWCYPLDPHQCLNRCEASWPWYFCFFPLYSPSLAGLVMVSLVTERVKWDESGAKTMYL